MSKAYDSVNLDLLKLALERIQIPSQLCNIITNLLTNRTNRVITNLGLTEPYNINNSIDQGETITPLLWRIYYDPLINKISTFYQGYTMSATCKDSILTYKYKNLKVSSSVLAYMDDILWITNSKSNLESIIQTATSFYQMANIQINPHKSVLITNTKKQSHLNFINSSIQPQQPNIPFKFLGCWFTLDGKQTQQTKLITNEISHLTNTLKTKHITNKQVSYIINTVIIPILEYHIHNIILSQTTCNKILSSYLSVAKHKSNFATTTPNSTLLNHNIYGIKNIWDIQLQYHISNFLTRLCDTRLLGISTQIRLQQLQNNLWSTTNIL